MYGKYIFMKSKCYPFTGLTGQVIFFVNLQGFWNLKSRCDGPAYGEIFILPSTVAGTSEYT